MKKVFRYLLIFVLIVVVLVGAFATYVALKGIPNDAITNEVAFGRTNCSPNDSQCAAAESVRSIVGIDAAAYQKKLQETMQDISEKRNADPVITVTNTQGSNSDDTGSGPSWQELQDFAGSGDSKKDDVGSGPSWQELQDFAGSGDKNNTAAYNPDLTGLLGPGLPVTLTPPKITSDLYTNDRIIDAKLSVYDEKRVITVPAKTVKTIDLYETSKITVDPALYSFVSDEEYKKSVNSLDKFVKSAQTDIKVIDPNITGLYAKDPLMNLPVMSPGELALVGKFDFSQGGKYNAAAEKQALELALRREIPSDVLTRIQKGEETPEDLIELTGIMSVLINRSISTKKSIYEHATANCQFTAVAGCTIVQKDGTVKVVASPLIPKSEWDNPDPKLMEAVNNLVDGSHAKEFGLTNIEPDELAYASHYYNKDTIGKPLGWDLDPNLPRYQAASGHIFGNVKTEDGKGYTYSVAGATVPLDYGAEEEGSVVLTHYGKSGKIPALQAIDDIQNEVLTEEERIKRSYQEYTAGRVAARNALQASAEVTKQQLEKSCPDCKNIQIISKGQAAGVDEFQIVFDASTPGTPGRTYTAEESKVLEEVQKAGGDITDPNVVAGAFTLYESSKDFTDFKATLGKISLAAAGKDAVNRLMNDFATGQNTVEGSWLGHTQGVPEGAGGLTQFMRDQINAERAKNNEAPLTAQETAALMKEKAAAIQAELAGKPGESRKGIAFADLTPAEQERYLGMAVKDLQVAQKKAQDDVYAAYEESLKPENVGTPVIETASGCKSFVCSAFFSPFGGLENARANLEKAANANTGQLCDCAVIEEENFGPSRPNAVNESYEEKMELALTPLQEKYPGLKFIAYSGTHEDPNHDPAKDDGHPSGRHAHGNGADGQFYIDGKLVTDKQTLNDIGQALALVDDNVGIGYSNKSGTFTHVDFEPKTKGTEWGYSGGFPTDIAKAVDTGRAGTQIADVSVQSYDEYKEGKVVLTDTGGSGNIAKNALLVLNTLFPKEAPVVHTDDTTGDTVTTTTPTQPTKPQTIGEIVGGTVDKVIDTVTGFFTPKPGGKTPTVTDSIVENDGDSDSNSNNDNPQPEPEPEEELTIDLTAKATEPAQSNANEYRFKGNLTRVYSRDQSYDELQKYFSVTLENKLNLDYSCDGSVDVQKTFTIPYRTFAWSNNTSTVLLSEYVSVATTGSHCFWFEIDTKNVVKEVLENNNVSNKYNFTI